MSQHDFIIDNQSGAAFRADVNGALGALATCSSGATEPATKYAFQWWADTASGILKQRNAANTAWLSVLTLATGNPLSLTTAQTSYKNKLINPNFSINQRAYQSGPPSAPASMATTDGRWPPRAIPTPIRRRRMLSRSQFRRARFFGRLSRGRVYSPGLMSCPGPARRKGKSAQEVTAPPELRGLLSAART